MVKQIITDLEKTLFALTEVLDALEEVVDLATDLESRANDALDQADTLKNSIEDALSEYRAFVEAQSELPLEQGVGDNQPPK